MKLIEDLGVLPISENSIHKARFGIYECSDCKEHFKTNTSKVKSRGIELCPKCAKDGRHKKRHGDTGTKLHNTWLNMKARCYNPNNTSYKHYGKLGVRICDEWYRSYETFKEWAITNGYSEELSIDRIEPSGNYCPENCRWVNMSVQNSNKNIRIKANGLCTGIHPYNNKFKVTISYEDKVTYLGLFLTLEEAAKARNDFIEKNNLPHTKINLSILKEHYDA